MDTRDLFTYNNLYALVFTELNDMELRLINQSKQLIYLVSFRIETEDGMYKFNLSKSKINLSPREELKITFVDSIDLENEKEFNWFVPLEKRDQKINLFNIKENIISSIKYEKVKIVNEMDIDWYKDEIQKINNHRNILRLELHNSSKIRADAITIDKCLDQYAKSKQEYNNLKAFLYKKLIQKIPNMYIRTMIIENNSPYWVIDSNFTNNTFIQMIYLLENLKCIYGEELDSILEHIKSNSLYFDGNKKLVKITNTLIFQKIKALFKDINSVNEIKFRKTFKLGEYLKINN